MPKAFHWVSWIRRGESGYAGLEAVPPLNEAGALSVTRGAVADVTLTESPPPPAPAYTEAHSALNGPLLARYLLAPVVAETAFMLAGLTARQQWFFVFMGWLFVPVMIWITLLYRNWPTGIRLDQAAVGIGAVGSPRAASRTPTVSHQSRGLFTCPWPAVRGIRVVTDRSELRQMKNSPRYYTLTYRWGTERGMSHCNTGVLASPFMRAAPAQPGLGRTHPAPRSRARSAWLARLIHCPAAVSRSFPAAVNAHSATATRQASG